MGTQGNCHKNGLLPVVLDEATVERLVSIAEADPTAEVTIDLDAQTVRCGDVAADFEIDPAVKHRLLNGLDDIAITLRHDDAISRYEAGRPSFKPTVTPTG